jgi:histidinol phosphatase-like enzyme
MSQSIVIGDKDRDVEFGQRAGAITMPIAKLGARPSTTPEYDRRKFE